MATNPMTPQGVLNRARASMVFAANTALNINSSHMSKKFVNAKPDEDSTDQPETATGVVSSPKIFVMYTATVGIVRSQPLAAAWLAQFQANCQIGRMTIHSDTSVFPKITVHNCSLLKVDPNAYDGLDPTVDLTIKGVFYVNNYVWNLI